MPSPKIVPPAGGTKITIQNGKLNVPDNPILPFIEGDGTGRDIWRASVRVFDAAVEKAYGGKRKIHWLEVFAGEKAFKLYNNWLPDETPPRTAIPQYHEVNLRRFRLRQCNRHGTPSIRRSPVAQLAIGIISPGPGRSDRR